ncbi:hypothetical protein RI054_16g77650 [Pseudoscourfieldia marina]
MVWLEKTKDTPEGAYKAVVISLDGANGNLEVLFEGDNNTYSVHVDNLMPYISFQSRLKLRSRMALYSRVR